MPNAWEGKKHIVVHLTFAHSPSSGTVQYSTCSAARRRSYDSFVFLLLPFRFVSLLSRVRACVVQENSVTLTFFFSVLLRLLVLDLLDALLVVALDGLHLLGRGVVVVVVGALLLRGRGGGGAAGGGGALLGGLERTGRAEGNTGSVTRFLSAALESFYR